MQIGLDILNKNWPRQLKGSKVGLLVHPASVNRKLQHAVDLFIKSKRCEVRAIFGPQHGIRGETQDNMIEWKGFRDKKTGLSVYSLYSYTRRPDKNMLKDMDVLVIDMQDIGSRYYTYIWTMELCMDECNETGKAIVILDRPNPLGGLSVEGPVLDMKYASFVGQRPLPVRHGMTIGEICTYLQKEYYPSLELHIIPMKGWRREMWFDETGLTWVMPSPNMPTLNTALVYPGMCLLEGTNLSEGRGTTRPFEIFGAPFIDTEYLVKHLRSFKLPGVYFRPLYFQPTFQKYAGRLCGGVQIHVTNRNKFKPFKTGIVVLKAIRELYPQKLTWKKPPYEYEKKRLPIDILAGTDRIRRDIDKGIFISEMEKYWREQISKFNRNNRKKYLLYG